MWKVITHLIDKLGFILSTIWGWLAALGLMVTDYFAGQGVAISLVVGMCILDAAWRIALAIKIGDYALSELARQTFAKLAVYGTTLYVFSSIDKLVIGTTLTTPVIASLIALVEFWSTSAIMLCLFPYIPLLKLLKKALTGEIASKLNIQEEEVEQVLKEGVANLNPQKNKDLT